MFNKNIYFKLLLATTTALMIYFSFEYPWASFLIWFSLVPFLYVLDRNKVFYSISIAAYTGIFTSLLLFYWVSVSMLDKSLWSTIISTPLLSSYIWLLITGIWTFFLCTAGSVFGGTVFIFYGAATWVFMEVLRIKIFSSFPLAVFGYTQYKVLPIIQIAEFTGVSGVSFLIVFFNLALFVWIRNLRNERGERKKEGYKPLLVAAGLVLFVYLFGIFLKNNAYSGFDSKNSIKIAALQPNIPQKWKWNPMYEHIIKYDISRLISQVADEKPDLIIWPEAAVTGVYSPGSVLVDWVNSQVKKSKTAHLFGAPFSEGPALGDTPIYNSTILLDSNASLIGRHDKIKTVIFGEYIPFRKLFPFLNFLTVFGDITPGKKHTIIPFKTVNIGSFICSESFYGRHVSLFAKQGADILINNSNDAWLKETSGSEQHFSMNVFRAVENRKMLLECANTGVTAVIAPTGGIVQRLPTNTRGYLIEYLTPNYKTTFYTKYGEVFSSICIVFSIIFTIAGFFMGGFRVFASELPKLKKLIPKKTIRKIVDFILANS